MKLIAHIRNDYQPFRHKLGVVKFNLGNYLCNYSLYLLEQNQFKSKLCLYLTIPKLQSVIDFEIIVVNTEIIQITTDFKYFPAFLLKFLHNQNLKMNAGIIDVI